MHRYTCCFDGVVLHIERVFDFAEQKIHSKYRRKDGLTRTEDSRV